MTPVEVAGRLARNLAARWSHGRGAAETPVLARLVPAAALARHSAVTGGVAEEGETAAALLWQAALRRTCFPFQRNLPPDLPAWFGARWPESYAALLRTADAVAVRRFRIFEQTLDFPGKVDWHFDPLAQRTMPVSHWTAIAYWRPGVCPGVKHIWELNRHQHFVTLAQAFLLSGESRYARALLEQWQNWLDENPPHLGINWTSALELGLRLLSWSWALQLAKRSPLFTPDFYARLLGSVHQQAEFISRHLSRHSSANNHLLGECLGLICAGCYFPELKAAQRWRQRGFSLFFAEFERQVHPDGVIREQSTCYQRYLFDYGMLAVMAAEHAGHDVPAAAQQRLEKMAEFIAALIDESGQVPQIGDGDGGQALLLDPAWIEQQRDAAAARPQLAPKGQEGAGRSSTWRDLLGAAALRCHRGDFKSLSASWSPALFWLYGAEGEAQFSGIHEKAAAEPAAHQPSGLPARPLQLFDEGGYAVLNSGAAGFRQIGVFDAGPLGLDAMAAHGHADALNFLLTAGGTPLLIDSGTYTYRGEAAWRNYFRGTAAHNTIRIAEMDQSQIVGPFQWGRRANARFVDSGMEEEWLSVAGEHDGYRRLGVIHRRVVRVAGGEWLIDDHLTGAGPRAVELFWHMAPCRCTWRGPGLLEADFGGCRMLVRVSGPESLQMRIDEGRLLPPQGWFSPHFAVKKSNPVLCVNTNEPLPVHIRTEIRIEPVC